MTRLSTAALALACSPTLERIGSATDGYTRSDGLRPEGGPPPGMPMWRYRLQTLWALLTR